MREGDLLWLQREGSAYHDQGAITVEVGPGWGSRGKRQFTDVGVGLGERDREGKRERGGETEGGQKGEGGREGEMNE